ncbi:antirestriction protein [Paraburkholderia graminis]
MQVTAKPVPFVERLTFLPKFFGPRLMMRAEALLYTYAGRFSPDNYNGGLWEYYTLSNGGGYAAPISPARLQISIMGNGYEGEMSSDAAGIVISLFVLNTLAFECSGKDESLTEKLVEHWEQLREYAAQHPEARSIYRAID